MRLRSLMLALLGTAAGVILLRRRTAREFVDVAFDDGSTIRLARGPEARDLLEDAYAILDTAS